jgi:ATP-binding cassette, subfamily B, multidrug efflux pump
MGSLKYFNKYLYKYRYRFGLGIIFIFFANVFGIYPPQVVGYAFDLVKENISLYHLFDGFLLQHNFYTFFSAGILFFGALSLFLACIRGFFMFLMRQSIIVMSRHIEYDQKNELYNHYQQLDLNFFKQHNTGDLMSRITEDISRVRNYFGPGVMYTINLIALFSLVIITMLHVNTELTLFSLLPLPLLSILIFYINSIIQKKSERIQRQLSVLTSEAQEAYSGIRLIKAYGQEKNNGSFFEQEAERYKQKNLNLARVEALFFPTMFLLVGLSTILTIFIGGREVIEGKITPGNIAEFVIYITMLSWPIASVGWVIALIQRAVASQIRINEFLNTKPTITSPNNEKHIVKGNIEFRNVNFKYTNTGIQALSNISFKLRAGQKLAIIGRTGSGKSTIPMLLTRQYDVDAGAILIDDKNIKEYELANLRTHLGYVPQDVFLFSDTVEQNISFGAQDDTHEQVEHYAKLACVHNDIMYLTDGYKTVIGERGVTLSGGQKQRISIARALIKNPPVLIFDDCLSAVDANTERLILGNLNNVLKHKTALIITHRIFTLLNLDHIIVLDEGKIAEEGTHNDLMKMHGIYAELFELQKEEERNLVQ